MKIEEAKMIFSKYFKDGPGKDFVMSVMDSIEYPEAKSEKPKKQDTRIIKEADVTPSTNDYPQKPKKKKVCESCGKEFYPNSGVQKLCLECRRQKEDISKTAREMLNL